MNKAIANTEIRALDDAELDMISGGNLFGNFFTSIQNVEKNILAQIQHAQTIAFLNSMDTMSGGPGKSHYSR